MTTPDFLAKLTELTKFLLFPVFSITTSNFSESIETIKNFRYMVDWVWIDCFKKIPLDVKIYKLLRKYKYKICLVSPELHDRRVKNERTINLIKQKKINIDMLCTKIKFFNAWKKRLSL